MTPTDELLTLLKKHGMEHYRYEVHAEKDCVAFYDGNRWHDCWESVDGEVNVTFSMTPEQAVAATVGRGTCQMECEGRPTERTLDVMGVYFCSKCGSPIYNDCMPSYCIYCGAEVTL